MKSQGLSYGEIGRRLNVSLQLVSYWLRDRKTGIAAPKIDLKAQYLEEVLNLRKEGYSYDEISQKLGLGHTTVYRWIANFAEKSTPTAMASSQTDKPTPEKTDCQAPSGETDEQKIARLESELRMANLKADLYKEIIDVAEKKFNIDIIKKAGTKQ